LTVDYFAQAYDGGHVEFTRATIDTPSHILGAQCIPAWGGRIKANGLALPCTIAPQSDGKYYP
jgi:hypothetical protein